LIEWTPNDAFIQTIFLPLIGLVEAEKLKPGDLIGVNKDSYLVLEQLPAEYVYSLIHDM
jgi:ATP-dependent 26S proteasome regulatory subunit